MTRAICEIVCGATNVVPQAVTALREDGVVVLREALAAPGVTRYAQIVDEWHGRFLRGEIQNYSLDDETATELPDVWEDTFVVARDKQSLRKWNAVQLDSRFIPLTDTEPLYSIMSNLLGPQLAVTKTQFLVVPSGCVEPPYLHTDAGSMADIVLMPESAPLMCSIQIFLTPLALPFMGNFTCVVGSHRTAFPWGDNLEHSQITGTPLGTGIPLSDRTQVLAEAGDAVLFLHSLWHGVSPNNSGVDRRSVINSYARSFVRPYDYHDTPPNVVDHGTLRQRALFGDLGGWAFRPGCNYHYSDRLKALLSSGGGATPDDRTFSAAG